MKRAKGNIDLGLFRDTNFWDPDPPPNRAKALCQTPPPPLFRCISRVSGLGGTGRVCVGAGWLSTRRQRHRESMPCAGRFEAHMWPWNRVFTVFSCPTSPHPHPVCWRRGFGAGMPRRLKMPLARPQRRRTCLRHVSQRQWLTIASTPPPPHGVRKPHCVGTGRRFVGSALRNSKRYAALVPKQGEGGIFCLPPPPPAK